jgi:isopentenyldiphosphate isomerase
MPELMEVIDLTGRTIKVIPREEIIISNYRHKAAFVIVQNNKGEIYINQRKKNRKVYPLKWVVGAGGGVKAYESYEIAAKRELKEELGVVSEIEYLFDFSFKSDQANYLARVYIAKYDGEVVLNLKESEQGKWAPKEEIIQFIAEHQLCPDTEQYIMKYFTEFA